MDPSEIRTTVSKILRREDTAEDASCTRLRNTHPKLYDLVSSTEKTDFDESILEMMLAKMEDKQTSKTEKDMDVSMILADRFVYVEGGLQRPSDEAIEASRKKLLSRHII